MPLLSLLRSAWARFNASRAPSRPRKPVRRALLQIEPLEERALLSTMSIGMNLERIADYSPAWMFTDAFKSSRPWQSQIYNTATHQESPDTNGLLPVSVNALGWPTQLNQTTNAQGQVLRQMLSTDMFLGLGGHFPAGTYTAQWDGTGTIWWNGDVRVTQMGNTPDGHHFALLVATPGNNGIGLTIATMSSTDPIHDIHIWLPDYQGQSFVGQVWYPGANFSPFHPLFLQRLEGFTTLRFMQEQSIIPSQIQHWSDRRPWNYATQMTAATSFQNGMAPEYMIELCNELHADLWVNIPYMAQDDYIVNLAKLVRDTLNPGLKVYVEWSNEAWNSSPGYMTYPWLAQEIPEPPTAPDWFYRFTQLVAQENRHTFAIWTQVFAGQTSRLVRTVGAFEANPIYTARVLQGMNGEFDAVAPAAYFGPTPPMLAGYTASTTVDQIIQDTAASIPTWLQLLSQSRALADQYSAQLHRHIALVAYEGGPAFEAHNAPYQIPLNAASEDPRLYDIYSTFLRGAANVGLELLVNFQYTGLNQTNSPYGCYGALNYQDEPTADAPRYHALIDYIMSNQPATGPVAPLAGTTANVKPAETTPTTNDTYALPSKWSRIYISSAS